jgi:hypothetical protein
MKEIGFIHIPKTGGANFKHKNKSNLIDFGKHHDEDARYYEIKGIPCFAIVRDPVDRFISAFKYNVSGSETFGRNYPIKDINLFIENIKTDKFFLNNFEEGIQFKKQVDFLNGDPDNTYIIRYSNDYLVSDIIEFLQKEFDIDFIYDYFSENINISNDTANYEMSEENRAYILDLYKDDVILYNKLKTVTDVFITQTELDNMLDYDHGADVFEDFVGTQINSGMFTPFCTENNQTVTSPSLICSHKMVGLNKKRCKTTNYWNIIISCSVFIAVICIIFYFITLRKRRVR